MFGAVKGVGEIATGWNMIETYEDAELREARWEIFGELLAMEQEAELKGEGWKVNYGPRFVE